MTGSIRSKGLAYWPQGAKGRDLGSYALVLIDAGGGYYADGNGFEQQVSAGDVLVLFPGLYHRYGRRAQDPLWSEHYVVFNGPLFSLLEDQELYTRSEPIWHTGSDSHFRQDFVSLVADVQAGRLQSDEHLLFGRLHALIAEARHLHQRQQDSFIQWREQVCAELSAHLGEELSLEGVATKFNMSEQVFRKRFKKEAGISPQQFRLQCRLDHAQELLLDDTNTLDDVAELCGFCDQYHFSRIFKRHRNMSPGSFRKLQGLSPRARN